MKLMAKAHCKDPDAVTMPETITTLTLELTQTQEELLSWCMVFMTWAELGFSSCISGRKQSFWGLDCVRIFKCEYRNY